MANLFFLPIFHLSRHQYSWSLHLAVLKQTLDCVYRFLTFILIRGIPPGRSGFFLKKTFMRSVLKRQIFQLFCTSFWREKFFINRFIRSFFCILTEVSNQRQGYAYVFLFEYFFAAGLNYNDWLVIFYERYSSNIGQHIDKRCRKACPS